MSPSVEERQAAERGHEDHARHTAREKHDRRLAEARVDMEAKAEEARRAQLAANAARAAHGSFGVEHALRAGPLHEGVDLIVRRAESTLHARVIDMRGSLMLGAGSVGDMPTLFLATSPEFVAALHALVDAPVTRGNPPVSPLSEEEFAAGAAERKAAWRKAQQEERAAQEVAWSAARLVTAIEHGQA